MVPKVTIFGAISLLLSAAAFEILQGTRMEALCPLFLLCVLGGVLCVAVVSAVCLVERRSIGFIGGGVAALVASWLFLSFIPGGDRIVSRVTASDGTEACVVQSSNGVWTEPYTIDFYYRRPGGNWGWFYYDHQDTRWWFGRIEVEAGGRRFVVRRSFLPVAFFDIPAETFTLARSGRSSSPAQEWMPPDWAPEKRRDRR